MATGASAQQARINADEAFRQAVDDSIGEMRIQPNCVGHRDRYRLAFIGIPDGDPRLTPSERAALNNALRAALRQSRVPLTPSSAENAGILATLTQAIDMDAAEFEERLSQLEADFTVLVRTQRPGPETAVMQISVFARPGDGGPGCDEIVDVAIDLPTMSLTYDAPLFGDFRTLDGAVGPFLLRNSPRLREAESIAWRVNSDFPEGCPLPRRIGSQLDAIYFQAARTHAEASVGGAEFPGIVTDPTTADILLTARVSPSAEGSPVVSLALSLADNGVLFDRVDHQIIHGEIPESCLGEAVAVAPQEATVDPDETAATGAGGQEQTGPRPAVTDGAETAAVDLTPVAFLGLELTPTEMELSALYNAGEGPHLVVTALADGEGYGLSEGDVIVQAGQQPVTGLADLEARIAEAEAAGERTMMVLVDRNGAPTFVAFSLPEPEAPAEPVEVAGLTLLPSDIELSERYVAADRRLVITAIDDSRIAASAGIAVNDVLVEVNQQIVTDPAEVQAMIDAARAAGETSLTLLLDRDGTPRFAALAIAEPAPDGTEQTAAAVPDEVEEPTEQPGEQTAQSSEQTDGPRPVPAEETPVQTAAPQTSEPEGPGFINVLADKQTYRSGDEMQLAFVSPRDCRLSLLAVGDDGRSCLILPHPQAPVILLEANVPYRFPPEPAKLYAADPGLETFMAFCDASDAAISLEQIDTVPFDCVAGSEEATDIVLETVTIDFGGTGAASQEVLRGEVTVEILP